MACFKKHSVFWRPVIRGCVKMNLVEGSGSQIELLIRHLTGGFKKKN
jgi:hypothetical protein